MAHELVLDDVDYLYMKSTPLFYHFFGSYVEACTNLSSFHGLPLEWSHVPSLEGYLAHMLRHSLILLVAMGPPPFLMELCLVSQIHLLGT